MKAPNFSIFVLLAIIVSACSTPPQKPTETEIITSTTADKTLQPEELISKAIGSDSPQQQTHLFFKAAEAYWKNNLFAQSDAALGSVQTDYLTEDEIQRYLWMTLTFATQNANRSRIEKTMALISRPQLNRLNVDQQLEFGLLIARAQEIQQQNIEAALTLIDIRGFFDQEQLQGLDEEIWRLLRTTPTPELSQYEYKGNNSEAIAWLDLARTIQLNQINLESQYLALQAWNELWPNHPASLSPPHELTILQQLPKTRPDTITLALPLSGPLQSAGKAIRDGFMANYFAEQKVDTQQQGIKIHFFDTAKEDIISLYNNANSPNSLIIGPLDKQSLHALKTLDVIDTPTLALNYLPISETPIKNLYQLGLSPETEATQLAQHLNKKELKRVGIILPENKLGFRIYDTFSTLFAKLEGAVVKSAFYKDQASLASSVAQLLGTADSHARKRKIQNITNTRLEFLPRRRQDIDALIMIAKPETARQLKPLFAFHYASDLPVFANSQVHNNAATNNNRDLDGIEFIEMPWMLSNTIDIKKEIQNAIPASSEQYTRFYALGADSYNLAPRLKLLQEVQGSQMQGHTGTLSMNEFGIINREMEWAIFKKGKAIIIKE